VDAPRTARQTGFTVVSRRCPLGDQGLLISSKGVDLDSFLAFPIGLSFVDLDTEFLPPGQELMVSNSRSGSSHIT